MGWRHALAWLQLDRHDRPPRSIFDDGHQRPVRRGRPPPTLNRPPHRSMSMGSLGTAGTLPSAGALPEFAASLAARSDAELLRLFALRPDAITPPVRTFADLASRLSTAASINAALDQLSLRALRVLAALPVGGLVPEDLPELTWLHELALALRADPSLKHDAGTHHFLPLTAVTLALGNEDSLLGSTPPGLADLAGLREAPQPRLTPVSPSLLDNAVGSAVETLLRTMSELLEVVNAVGAGNSGAGNSSTGASGLSTLRDGTLGVRTLRELSKALGLDAQTVNFYLELAAAAHLIFFDETTRRWRTDDSPAPERHAPATTWNSMERAEQWFVLVRSWLNNARPPSALIKALEPYDPPRPARQWRRRLLSVMRSLDDDFGSPSSAAPDLDSVLTALSWQHPRQTAALSHEVPALLQELEWLGITGAGAVSSPGREVAGDEDSADASPALAAMRELLPAPVDHFVLQGDLTAIAPGFLVPNITSTLRLMAVAEGRGAAGIFRFSQHSLASAAVSGMTRSAVLDFLQQHSSTAVPQPLDFLIAEVFRNSPDESSEVSPEASPSLEAAQPELAQQTPPGNGVVREEAEAVALTQLKRLRSQPVWANDGVGESGPALVMEELRRALGRSDLIWVRVVDGAGEIEELLLRPVSLVAGTLRASLPGTDRERRLSIHRIISAAPERHEHAPASETTSTSSTGKERHG